MSRAPQMREPWWKREEKETGGEGGGGVPYALSHMCFFFKVSK